MNKIANCLLPTANFFLCLLTFSIFHQTSSIATVRYVSHTGTSTLPYTTWETAADSIMKAINISSFGDTIYVANGVYQEQITMIAGLSLIGAGMDSCVIDTRELVDPGTAWYAVTFADSCHLTGFKLIVSNDTDGGGVHISSVDAGILINNKIMNVNYGVGISSATPIIEKNIIKGLNGLFTDFSPIIESNYIEVTSQGINILFSPTAKPVIINNIIILRGNFARGYSGSGSDTVKIFNNLILSENSLSNAVGLSTTGVPHIVYNNLIFGDIRTGISATGLNNYLVQIKNNSIINSFYGIENADQNSVNYNNAWNNQINYQNFIPDSTNLSVDPMIVNDDTSNGELDFHLQRYSPLIDAGDPNILDRDGSRSDIGLYGGPFGWTYTYKDLAPRPPHNVTAIYEDGLIKITWNKNTEADFSHYRIYRDTISNFIYDSTKIIGETSDTIFYDDLPITNAAKKYYYLITAFDNQENQSAPSEEINITVTGITEHPPIGDDGYKLLSNYPNPFNPSTIIPYRLKEAGYVKLYIYDIKGELVKILVNQWQQKGYYEVVFHPNSEQRQKANDYEVPVGKTYSDIATGIYIYQLMVKGENNIPVFSDMGKMILLK